MLGCLPSLQSPFAEDRSKQELPGTMPKQMPCPKVGDKTPLKGVTRWGAEALKVWLFYWKPREKGWAELRSTHTLSRKHTAACRRTRHDYFRVSAAEWMELLRERPRSSEGVFPGRQLRHVSTNDPRTPPVVPSGLSVIFIYHLEPFMNDFSNILTSRKKLSQSWQ